MMVWTFLPTSERSYLSVRYWLWWEARAEGFGNRWAPWPGLRWGWPDEPRSQWVTVAGHRRLGGGRPSASGPMLCIPNRGLVILLTRTKFILVYTVFSLSFPTLHYFIAVFINIHTTQVRLRKLCVDVNDPNVRLRFAKIKSLNLLVSIFLLRLLCVAYFLPCRGVIKTLRQNIASLCYHYQFIHLTIMWLSHFSRRCLIISSPIHTYIMM